MPYVIERQENNGEKQYEKSLHNKFFENLLLKIKHKKRKARKFAEI